MKFSVHRTWLHSQCAGLRHFFADEPRKFYYILLHAWVGENGFPFACETQNLTRVMQEGRETDGL